MKRALGVIDVQNDYFSGFHEITYPEGSYENIQHAMDVAQTAGVPIAVVQHTFQDPSAPLFRKGTTGWELADGVRRRPYDILIEKHLPGSFTGTNLEQWLRQCDVDTVAIAGYMTQMCCDTTSRQAVHLGFSVEFLADSTGTHAFSNAAGTVTAEELHRAALVTQASRFAKVLTLEEWKGLLV